MTATAPPPLEAIDAALTRLIADGAAAAGLAGQLLADPATPPEQAAAAHALRAMVEFREGAAELGEQAVAAGRRLLPAGAAATPAAWLLDHAQALGDRRAGRLAEAEARLRPLHARAAERSAVQAYLSASALAIVVSMRGDDDASLELSYEALALARRTGDDSLLVNALNNLGSMQSDLHNLEDARPMLEECLERALRLGSRRQTIYAAGNLVQCLCQMGEPARALTLALDHLVPLIRPEDPPALQRDEEIAEALLDNGRIDEAEQRLAGAMHVDPLSNELGTARVWLMARIHLARGRAEAAYRLCAERRAALRADDEAGTMAVDRVNLRRVAAQAANATGAADEAYRLLDEAFTTHERLLGRAARARRLSLQVSHRLQQAEWERDKARELAAGLERLNGSLQLQVAENERLQLRLRAQAIEDPLTGLPNRRHLLEAGEAMHERAQRLGEPLAVAILDLDHFKRINDTHGHDAGDRVLRAVAELLRAGTRDGDLVCRYGGEEFVLLMPGAGTAAAMQRLDALRTAFRQRALPLEPEGSLHASFSAGVAQVAGDGDTLQAALSRADEALYRAKVEGRDRVRGPAVPVV